jgi:hypothetical protein
VLAAVLLTRASSTVPFLCLLLVRMLIPNRNALIDLSFGPSSADSRELRFAASNIPTPTAHSSESCCFVSNRPGSTRVEDVLVCVDVPR